MYKILTLVIPLLLITSCWIEQEVINISKNNQDIKTTDDVKINLNSTKENTKPIKNLIINNKMNNIDQKKYSWIINSNKEVHYLFVNKNLQQKIELLKERKNELLSWKIEKINSLTNKPFTINEYIDSRNKLIEFIHPITDEKSNRSAIDIDIYYSDFSYRNSSIQDFEIYNDKNWFPISISLAEAEERYNEYRLTQKLKYNYYIDEKQSLSTDNISKFLFIPIFNNSSNIKIIDNKINNLLEQIWINNKIERIASNYKQQPLNNWKFNLEEVLSVFNNLNWKTISAKSITSISKVDANLIIKSYEKTEPLKLTRILPSGMKISSNNLYVFVEWTKLSSFYIDDEFYILLKQSILNWWTDFIITMSSANNWYNHDIYEFISWYDINNSYYNSLNRSILEKWNLDILRVLFTLTINNDWSFKWNENTDIENNWLVSNAFQIIIWKKKIEYSNITKSEIKLFLRKLF